MRSLRYAVPATSPSLRTNKGRIRVRLYARPVKKLRRLGGAVIREGILFNSAEISEEVSERISLRCPVPNKFKVSGTENE